MNTEQIVIRNIVQAVKHPDVFGGFLGGDPATWTNWQIALKSLYGLPILTSHSRQLVRQCTGRDPNKLPDGGFDTALFLTGRRSGKSRMAAVIGAYEAVLAGHEEKLAAGEQGMVAIISPSRYQSRIVKGYLRAVFDSTPVLQEAVVREEKSGFTLANGTLIEILAGDFRTIRGYTLLAAIVDEAAFFGLDEEARVKSDTELIRAIQPSLATTQGKLIAITTPYARRGWTWKTYQRHYGNDRGRVLVWNSPSRVMYPTLPQSVVDLALAEDLQSAKCEYLGEFRDDVAEFLPRHVLEGLVKKDRFELMWRSGVRYFAFCDVSGGRRDDSALAIAHKENEVVVVDAVRRWPAPHNPYAVIHDMVHELRRWGIHRVMGDNYAAEFVDKAFKTAHVHYTRCEKPKSQLYAELLPRLCSGQIELLDDRLLLDQLAGLERRTRSGGKDVIDHPPGGHDDVANAVAGVAVVAGKPRIEIGAFR